MENGRIRLSSIGRKLLGIRKQINAEPILFLMGLAAGLDMVIGQPFYYWRRCAELYWQEVCFLLLPTTSIVKIFGKPTGHRVSIPISSCVFKIEVGTVAAPF